MNNRTTSPTYKAPPTLLQRYVKQNELGNKTMPAWINSAINTARY